MRFVWVVILSLVFTLRSISVEPVQKIDQQVLDQNLSEIIDNMGNCKLVSPLYESVFYNALKYYPELKDTRIVVRVKDIKTTMQCRPRFDFFLHKPEKRTYIVFIDNKKKDNNGVLYSELSIDARVGVMGHEIAHVLDYSSMNSGGIIKFGIDYLNKSKRKKIENGIDEMAINRGLGHQINAFSEYVFEDPRVSDSYRNYKRKFYFKPRQIKQLIAQNPIYSTDGDVLID